MPNVMQPLPDSMVAELAARAAHYQQQADGARTYLQGRGLSVATCEAARLGYAGDPYPGDEQYQGCLVIPHVNLDGVTTGIRFRRLDGGKPKYTSRHGERFNIYNLNGVAGARVAHIAEGEIDALSLVECGLSACGMPGASYWKPWMSLAFAGCEQVFVWADGDEAGDRLADAVTDSLQQAVRVTVPRGEDVNSLLTGGGAACVTGLIPR